VKMFIDKIEESKTWTRSRNQEKGALLEDFAVFLFERFQNANVKKNRRPTDNEMDVEISLSEIALPQFMRDYLAPKIICECKNKAHSTVDVGMVAKLAELLPGRGSKIGIFISINGISGSGWRYGEGKRKKILIKDGIPIISFRVKELEKILQGKNFYTMIKEKINNLFDEVDDDSPDAPAMDHYEYKKRMNEIIFHLEKCHLINNEESQEIRGRLIKIYGELDGF
ncbi:restriction endonuclease, partial [Paenibacillus terrae]